MDKVLPTKSQISSGEGKEKKGGFSLSLSFSLVNLHSFIFFMSCVWNSAFLLCCFLLFSLLAHSLLQYKGERKTKKFIIMARCALLVLLLLLLLLPPLLLLLGVNV
jgi:hypothetical protein